jgi:hypothetical protein
MEVVGGTTIIPVRGSGSADDDGLGLVLRGRGKAMARF